MGARGGNRESRNRLSRILYGLYSLLTTSKLCPDPYGVLMGTLPALGVLGIGAFDRLLRLQHFQFGLRMLHVAVVGLGV